MATSMHNEPLQSQNASDDEDEHDSSDDDDDEGQCERCGHFKPVNKLAMNWNTCEVYCAGGCDVDTDDD